MNDQKNSRRQHLRHAPVSLEMAGTFLGLIFGGLSLFASLLAQWAGPRPDRDAVQCFAVFSFILLSMAVISIAVRLWKVSPDERLGLMVRLTVGFTAFALDVGASVLVETYFTQSLLRDVFLVLAIVVGLGTAGLMAMAKAFI